MAAPGPTLAGFQAFLVAAGINTTILPADSPVIPFALAVALNVVNPQLQGLGTYCGPPLAGVPAVSMYTLAVYNCATDNVFNYADDQPGADPVPGSNPPTPFFAWSRSQWNIFGFVSGVIQSAGDESTNQSMVVQEAAKYFTLANLQSLKTPYGRRFLAISQSYGPNAWGIS